MKVFFSILFVLAGLQATRAEAASTCYQGREGLTAYGLTNKSYVIKGDTLTLTLEVGNYICSLINGEYKWLEHRPLEMITRPSPMGGEYTLVFHRADAMLTTTKYKLIASDSVKNELTQTFIFNIPIKDYFGTAKTGRLIFLERFFTETKYKGVVTPQEPYTGGEYVIELNLP